MKRILVTGARGQIGSELTNALRARYGDERVIATDVRMPAAHDDPEPGPFQLMDCLDPNHITRVMQRFEVGTIYHLAAVLAGNLAPVLLAEAAGLLVQAGVRAHLAGPILEPLARSALKHATAHGAAAALTGPAARGDETTIQAHRAALAEHAPGLATLYDARTQRAKQRLEGD